MVGRRPAAYPGVLLPKKKTGQFACERMDGTVEVSFLIEAEGKRVFQFCFNLKRQFQSYRVYHGDETLVTFQRLLGF